MLQLNNYPSDVDLNFSEAESLPLHTDDQDINNAFPNKDLNMRGRCLNLQRKSDDVEHGIEHSGQYGLIVGTWGYSQTFRSGNSRGEDGKIADKSLMTYSRSLKILLRITTLVTHRETSRQDSLMPTRLKETQDPIELCPQDITFPHDTSNLHFHSVTRQRVALLLLIIRGKGLNHNGEVEKQTQFLLEKLN